MKKILVNPNFVYIIAFIIPFVVYSLGWSTLYPQLTGKLFLFYLFTFSVCMMLGVLMQRVRPFHYKKVPEASSNLWIIVFMFSLYLVEIIYSRSIPLVAVLTGTFDYETYSFGIPVVHTFLISFNTFYCIYVFHQYISSGERRLLGLFLLSASPFLILMSRSSILHILLGIFFVFLFSRKSISAGLVAKSAGSVLLVLYLFGVLGDIRTGMNDPTYIPRSSGAKEEFLESKVPTQFYWSYLYIASPVANLQNNINYTKVPEGGFKDLVLNECLPSFLTKFIVPQEEREFYQINPFLNVGTIYVFSFSYLRWYGIFFMFFYFLALINFYYYILIKSDTWSVTGLAILCNVIIFANFHNTVSYSVISLQLLYPLLFSAIKYLKAKKETELQRESLSEESQR